MNQRRPGVLTLAAACLLLAGALRAQEGGTPQDERERQAIELNNRGVALIDEGKLDEAIDALESAHRLVPDRAGIRANLAEAYGRRAARRLEAEKYHFARADFLHAAELEPGEGHRRLSAAVVLYRQEKYAEARDDLRIVTRLFPRLADGWYLLGDCERRLHDVIAAVEAWKKGSSIAPDHKGIAEQLARHGPDAELEKELYTDETYNFIFHYHLFRESVAKDAPTLRLDLEKAFLHCQSFFLGHIPRERIHVLLYNRKEFKDLTGTPEWAGGIYDGRIRVPVNHFARERERLNEVIRHELAHAFLLDIGKRPPIWLNEGLAQMAEGKSVAQARARLRRSGLLEPEKLWQPFVHLEDAKLATRAYDQSLALTARLEELYGRLALLDYVRALDREPKKKPEEVFETVFVSTFESQVQSLVESIRREG